MRKQLSDILRNITALRVVCIVVSLLFIPAFQFGVVSIWVIIFSMFIGFRFRAGFITLNEELKKSKDIKRIRFRTQFLILSLECMLYTAVALGVFFQLYVKELLSWPEFTVDHFDSVIQFFELLTPISFFEIADPRTDPSRYLMSVSNILTYFVLGASVMVSGRQGIMWGKVFIPKDFKGKSARDSLLEGEIPDDYISRIRGLWDIMVLIMVTSLLFGMAKGGYENLRALEVVISSMVLPYLIIFLLIGFVVKHIEYCSDMSLYGQVTGQHKSKEKYYE